MQMTYGYLKKIKEMGIDCTVERGWREENVERREKWKEGREKRREKEESGEESGKYMSG